MSAQDDSTAAKRLRRWWLTPPRSGLQRLIHPCEYRNLRPFARVRIAGGIIAAFAGLICVSYGVYGWAALFLALAALEIAGAYWYLTIARSASARA